MTKQKTHTKGQETPEVTRHSTNAILAAQVNWKASANQNRADKWASLIEACEMGSESGAETVRKLLAQRDELLVALKDLRTRVVAEKPDCLNTTRADAAIAKAEGN